MVHFVVRGGAKVPLSNLELYLCESRKTFAEGFPFDIIKRTLEIYPQSSLVVLDSSPPIKNDHKGRSLFLREQPFSLLPQKLMREFMRRSFMNIRNSALI